MPVKRAKPTNRGLSARLIEEFTRKPGETLYLNDLTKDLAAESLALRGAISYLRHHTALGANIEVVAPARAWRYSPNGPAASTGKRVFEELATTKSGDLIIQDAEGTLYRAVEL